MKILIRILLLFLLPFFLNAQIYWPNDLQYFKTELPKRHKIYFFQII